MNHIDEIRRRSDYVAAKFKMLENEGWQAYVRDVSFLLDQLEQRELDNHLKQEENESLRSQIDDYRDQIRHYEKAANHLAACQQEIRNKTDALDGYLEAMQQQRVDFDACIQKRAQLLAILKGLMNCPYTIDEASVPKAGIEANPDQVVGVLSLSYTRRKAAIAAADENYE